ncbi:hypothetical protein GCM10023116_41710 [Kistimonas scapharcae]|uniref:Uncharacterized protein n=2 Tax=Kistimonas scapharcae TaxID=1036133 RepID=A0ABP8VA82_9GAMM
MLLSVLQFCLMGVAEGKTMHPSSMESTMVMEMDSAMMMAMDTGDGMVHDCCLPDNPVSPTAMADKVCPDCEGDAPALQVSSPDLKPVFMLLFTVVQPMFDPVPQTRNWQVFTEPDIRTSLPDIYLAKAAFLE